MAFSLKNDFSKEMATKKSSSHIDKFSTKNIDRLYSILEEI
jgi:hypothetical protein